MEILANLADIIRQSSAYTLCYLEYLQTTSYGLQTDIRTIIR